MKKLAIFILIIQSIIFASCTSSSQNLKYDRAYFNAFPIIDDVIEHFYLSSPDELGSTKGYYKFHKKLDGWYAVRFNYNNPIKELDSTKVWDASSAKYLNERKASTEELMYRIKAEVQSQRLWNYFIMPLYGYKNSHYDVIKLLEGVKTSDLNASELEALSRAYYSAAVDQFGRNEPVLTYSAYDSTFDKSKITQEQVKAMEKYAQLSIKNTQEIIKRFPAHNTLVGSIKLKLANDCMTFYHLLMSHQQPEAAKKYLSIAPYDITMVELTKNYLRSCPQNSILITYGDNDTYPLWYVQEKLGFRKDVTIVNRSLAALGRYIYFLNAVIPAENQLKTTLNISHYKLDRNNFLSTNNAKGEPLDFSAFLKDFEKSKYDPKMPGIIPSKKLLLKNNATQIEIEYNNSVITKDEFFMLDVIATNWSTRPICFTAASSFSSGIYASLKPYLKQQGLIALLQTKKTEQSKRLSVDYKRSEELLYNEFTYPPFTGKEGLKKDYTTTYAQILYLQLSILQNSLELKKDDLLLKKDIEDCYRRFPIEKIHSSELHKMFILFVKSVNPNSIYISKHLDAILEDFKYNAKLNKEHANEPLYRYNMSDTYFKKEVKDMYDFLINNNFSDFAEEFKKALS